MSGSLRKYQIVILGPANQAHSSDFVTLMRRRVEELGDGIWECVEILEGARFDRTSPVVAIWFGSRTKPDPDHLLRLDELLAEAKIVIPAVESRTSYRQQTPDQLHEINGIEIGSSPARLDRLVNAALEGFQLLRRRRRLFISYARGDSRAVAKQLFGSLAERGYDVFLDTHSVPVAANFRHQLWHSMVDSDLVVLIDTDGIESSRWCREEYERADALSIGIVRVIWPTRSIDPMTDALQLSYPVSLKSNDFLSASAAPGPADQLTEDALEHVGNAVEGFRARSIAARQANLITAFQREATLNGVPVFVQPSSHILVEKADGRGGSRRIAVVPTVGVPVSTNYHDAFIEYNANPPMATEQVVLYDRRGFLPSWVDHLTWLHGKLPVKGIDVSEVPTWLLTP